MDYTDFLANITRTLTKNGYPDKRVALPLERMYEVAYEKQLNFNKALTLLEEQGIAHEKTAAKIIFYPKAEAAAAGAAPDVAEMMARASEMLKQMSPEQLKEIEAMYQGMTAEERDDLMKKAKDFGML